MIAGRHTLTGLGLGDDNERAGHRFVAVAALFGAHDLACVPGSEATNSIVTGLPPRESGC